MYKSLILPSEVIVIEVIVILGPKWGNWIVGKECEDFLDGAVDKNPPANAGERVHRWSGRIPHAKEQLSRWATTTEPGL